MDADTKQGLELCLRGVLAEELEPAIARVLKQRDQALGFPTEKHEVAEFRRGVEFSIQAQRLFYKAALAIGSSIMTAALVGILALAAWVFKTQLLK